MPLLFPENKDDFTLLDIIEYNFRPHKVEFKSKYINCLKIIKHKNEIKFSIVPEILIFVYKDLKKSIIKKIIVLF